MNEVKYVYIMLFQFSDDDQESLAHVFETEDAAKECLKVRIENLSLDILVDSVEIRSAYKSIIKYKSGLSVKYWIEKKPLLS